MSKITAGSTIFPSDVSWYAHENVGSKCRVVHAKILQSKNFGFIFGLLRRYRRCLYNTRYRQSKNGVTNYTLSL